MRTTLRLVAAAIIFVAPVAASAETLGGQVVDLSTYVTRDHNMDAMHMPAKQPMGHDAMAHESMGHACPPALGLVTHGGAGLYLLITQMGTKTGETLCKKLGRTVKLEGTVYDKSGMHAFLVSGAP